MVNTQDNNQVVTMRGMLQSVKFMTKKNGEQYGSMLVLGSFPDGQPKEHAENIWVWEPALLTRLAKADDYLKQGAAIDLECEVRLRPRDQGGNFKDLMSITNAVVNGAGQQPSIATPPKTQTTAPYPKPVATNTATWQPTASDEWRANGQQSGNLTSNATNLLICHLELSGGVLPNEQWIREAIGAIHDIKAAYLDDAQQTDDPAAAHTPEKPQDARREATGDLGDFNPSFDTEEVIYEGQ